jgi:hypothetical protein
LFLTQFDKSFSRIYGGSCSKIQPCVYFKRAVCG